MTWWDFIVLALAAKAAHAAWFDGSIFAAWRQRMQLKDYEHRSKNLLPGQPPIPFPEPEYDEISLPSLPLNHSDRPSFTEAIAPRTAFGVYFYDRFPAAWAAPFICRFCFSYHVPWMLFLLFLLPSLIISLVFSASLVATLCAGAVKLPLYFLAATCLIQLLDRFDE